jgi:membrane protease YdiL (CAAX protease family)
MTLGGTARFPCQTSEREAWLVLAPVLVTIFYYLSPIHWRDNLWVIFGPQCAAYVALAAWMVRNNFRWGRLGLNAAHWWSGLRQGLGIGVALGAINVTIIVWAIPGLGGDIHFLLHTPHAEAPVWLMFPVGIAAIGILVELNFRGFQLGRLAVVFGCSRAARTAAVVVSAFIFAWDPFMVHVFRSLHWIALWDGLVWGILFLRTGTLYATITAHTIEVWILYGSLKFWLG